MIPNEHEWLFVLNCINVNGRHISNFYICKEKQIRQNFVKLLDPGDVMAIQPKAWMTIYLFDSWTSHFVQALHQRSGISSSNCHLLVLNSHILYVMLFDVSKAAKARLDIVILPLHTSHHLQPLDIAIF